jgi:N6-adenosine-specific RNA methylase IME4
MDFPNKKYEVIYADPPWSYKQTGGPNGQRGMATAHYDTMPLDAIKALPVQNMVSDGGCALFLWATGPLLPEAIAVMEAWGFSYKGIAFAWVKHNRKSPSLFWGMGAYTRSNVELCLLGVSKKYKASDHVKSHAVHQVVVSPISRHSEKPDEVRQRITKLLGDIPRIELFARQKCAGWDAWGNEVLP